MHRLVVQVYLIYSKKKNQNVFCLSALMLMLIITAQGSFCITTALIQYKLKQNHR
jgi:hypothetical protein